MYGLLLSIGKDNFGVSFIFGFLNDGGGSFFLVGSFLPFLTFFRALSSFSILFLLDRLNGVGMILLRN